MPVITIPDPCLVVLVGAAGAGKSTFAARHFSQPEILSSDAYRALVSGDERDQRATRAAFGRLHRELARRLAARQLTVADATNVEQAARHALLKRSKSAGLGAIAIVFDLPEALVLARNAARVGRVVDEAIVRRHQARLRSTLDRWEGDPAAEGFANVVVLRDPLEVDSTSIVRVSA